MDIEAVQLLRNIELYTKVIAFALLILCLAKSTRFMINAWKWYRKNRFNNSMYEAIDEAKYDFVISQCKKIMKNKPNHSQANWYLALAYYHQGLFQPARDQFELVLSLFPVWNEKVEPYLSKTKEMLAHNNT